MMTTYSNTITPENTAEDEATTEEPSFPPLLRDPFQPFSVRLETTLRYTIVAFLGYCLAFADWPSALPASQQWLIGLFTSVIAVRLPTIAATPLATIFLFYTLLMFALASTTMILSAATISDAAAVCAAAIWALWISAGLRYGAGAKVTKGLFPSILVATVALMTLGLYRIVQDGLQINIDIGTFREYLVNIDLQEVFQSLLLQEDGRKLQVVDIPSVTDSELLQKLLELKEKIQDSVEIGPYVEALSDGVQSLLENLRDKVDGVEDNLEQILHDGIWVPIEYGPLAGRSLRLQFDLDEGITFTVEGGMWLVKRLWTWSGLQNPLAAFQNFIVVVSWAILCVYIGPLLPPLRTTRYALARIALPQALHDTAWLMKNRNKHFRDTTKVSTDESAHEEQVRRRLVSAMNVIHGGTIAVGSAFEPRFLDYRCRPPRCTWLELKKLTLSVEEAAMKALALDISKTTDYSDTALRGAVQAYQECAVALEQQHALDERDDAEMNRPSHDECAKDENALTPNEGDRYLFGESKDAVLASTISWFDSIALHPTGDTTTIKEGAENLARNVLPCIGPSLLFWAMLFEIPLIPFLVAKGKRTIDIEKASHCVKFAAGFVALFCMSVYWDAFREYETNEEQETMGISVLRGDPPSSYSGWHLLAYAFATMPTTEGTVKKCVLRLIGTFVGAFSAWAAIRATGDNDIGLVAWITITTFLSVYLSLEKSEKARLGQSKDYGYAGFYIILTQSVIVFDYVGGVGDGDDLVVDRIVSNVTGVLMASFLAVIPPRVMGGNPKWALLVAKKTKDGLRECAFCLLDDAAKEAADLDKMKSTYVREVNELRSDALYLLEDAKRMSFFPFFCVDTSLEEEIYSLAITSSAVATLYDQVSEAIHDPRYSQQSEEEESDLRRRVTQLVSGSVPEEVRISLDRKQVKNVADPVEALVEAMETINERIMLHQRKLGSSPAESKS